jgi:hypothetical protein
MLEYRRGLIGSLVGSWAFTNLGIFIGGTLHSMTQQQPAAK